MMELNAKSPFVWDWENLVMFNTKTIETPKKLQLIDSEMNETEGFDVGSFYSSSDVGYVSSSKSSKSTSNDSSIDKEMMIGTKLVSCGTKRTSSTIESSVASGESLIALELGRNYFEDVSMAKNSTPTSSVPPDKRSKSSSLNTETPCCQVEGCNLDLSSAKDYHRKHRVCESHSKSPKVIINGLERRFCQQCSRFHGLSEFDEKKRSCRRRLSDHNARRRKPKPEIIQFNSMRLTSPLYESRNQLSFAFNQAPVLPTRHGSFNSTSNSKVTLAKPGVYATTTSLGSDGLHSSHNGLQSPAGTELSPLSTHFLPSKGTPSQVFKQGFGVSSSNLEAAQDVRALSLLSTNSWDSSRSQLEPPQHQQLGHSMHQAASLAQPLSAVPMHADVNAVPPVSSWDSSAPATRSHTTSTFQLFKSPNESSFYLY